MAVFQRSAIGFALIIFMMGFQNCSKVDFSPSEATASSKAESLDNLAPEEPPITAVEDHVIEDVVSQNEACDSIFENIPAMDLKGQDYVYNGIGDTVSLGNGGNVIVNGITHKLSVNGADSIVVNGLHDALCLKGRDFLLNGRYGDANIPVVLIGTDAESNLRWNGILTSDLVLINIGHVSALNGSQSKTYVYGGQIDVINGIGKELHLMNSTNVKRINGKFDQIFVYEGSLIQDINGLNNIIVVSAKN
jgi:hypothetical protein